MSWKVPITTEVLKMDLITQIVFSHILLNCRKCDTEFEETFYNGTQKHYFKLNKGQCIFNISEFCAETFMKKNHIKRSLEMLEKNKNLIKMEITRKSFGLIITVQNYDELTRFENHSEITRKSLGNHSQITQSTLLTNKNVKNEEIDKNEEIVKTTDRDEIFDLIKNNYPKLANIRNLNQIINIIRAKPIGDREPFIDFVCLNKDEIDKSGYNKLQSKLGWEDWYWQEYLAYKKEKAESKRLADKAKNYDWTSLGFTQEEVDNLNAQAKNQRSTWVPR